MTEPGQAVIRYERVRKQYDDGTVAVEELDLDVREHELLALVGPSGCGKSTTLRMANRLVEPTSGRVLVEGADVAGTDPVELRRRMGYVIQNVGLFPHRTVEQNVAHRPAPAGLVRRPHPHPGRGAARAGRAARRGTYARRYPHQLSGGERQRVGVARALAADPPVLLMDEPFGAVDPIGRRRLQTEFGRIRRELGTTVMLVTHDIDEAVRLADRVAVFRRGGHLEQLADPVGLLARPATPMVADFVGRGGAVRLLSLGRLGPRRRPDRRGPARADGRADAVRAGGRDRRLADERRASSGSATRWTRSLGALATADGGHVPVLDEAGAVVGVATPDAVLGALRRMADAAGDDAVDGTAAS